jgi:hypothetical protein
MFRIYHPKYARIILPAILIAASFFIFGCNNDNKTETKTTDSSNITVDSTLLRDNTNMSGDTLSKDTTKGEQTPPPK